jgi:hypothetical protein
MLDRLVAYDSATMGAAQLLYKAYLRVIQVEGFREALAIGGKEEAAVLKQFKYMRQMQSNEGITLLDSKDTFAIHQYAFSGISDLLIQFGEQISGAWEIPLVRLFGQSPAGLSSTGASDIRNYYDGINKKQENQLRPKLNVLFDIMCRSELGKELPKDFEFKFIPLWQMNDKEKSEIATADALTVAGVYGAGIINKKISLQELKQQSRISGRFTNIVEENIKAAEKEDNARPPEGVEPVEEELSDEELLDIAESTELEETTDEWSEEARKKAIETRKRNANPEENKTNAEVPKKKLSDLNDSEKKRLTDILLKKIKQAKQKLENKEVKENVQKKLNEMIENLSSKVKHLNVNEKIEEMLKVDSIDVDSEEMKTVEMKKNDVGNKVSFKDKMVRMLEYFKMFPVYKNKDKGTVKSKNIENNKDESYTGNMGIIELFDFYKKANPEQTAIMEKIIKASDWFAFKVLIKKVLGVVLKDSEDIPIDLNKMASIRPPKELMEKWKKNGGVNAPGYYEWVKKNWAQEPIKLVEDSQIIKDFLESKKNETI